MSFKSKAISTGKYILSAAFAAAVEYAVPVIVEALTASFHKLIDAGAEKVKSHATNTVAQVKSWGQPATALA